MFATPGMSVTGQRNHDEPKAVNILYLGLCLAGLVGHGHSLTPVYEATVIIMHAVTCEHTLFASHSCHLLMNDPSWNLPECSQVLGVFNVDTACDTGTTWGRLQVTEVWSYVETHNLPLCYNSEKKACHGGTVWQRMYASNMWQFGNMTKWWYIRFSNTCCFSSKVVAQSYRHHTSIIPFFPL